MLKFILNRLKPHAQKIIADEPAGFRAGRSTIEQIFNLRIVIIIIINPLTARIVEAPQMIS